MAIDATGVVSFDEKHCEQCLHRTSSKGKTRDFHNVLEAERLKDHEVAVLLFAKKAQVSFTNNRAERDLRMGKVKQKVSGCCRQERFARAYCRITSYLQTMAYQGFNPLVAIQLALSGKLFAREV